MFIDHVSAAADEESAHKYSNFFNILGDILPCEKCRSHCKEYIKNNPPPTDNPGDLRRWVQEFHRKVNDRRDREPGSRSFVHRYAFSFVAACVVVIIVASIMRNRK